MAPGQQNLHAITLWIKDLQLNRTATHPLYKGRFGVRTSEASLDEWGNRQFHINGKHVLIRGGGWSPDIFLREQPKRLRQELEMVRDMGLNAIRLEGKMQSKQFFDWTDELGLMVLPGWCCCDAWQKWPEWGPQQYDVARESMRTQGRRLAIHSSVIVFLISSDWLPPQNVEALYLDTLKEENWPNPTISAASQAVSNLTGSTGVKMSGPYSWVPPSYWLLDVNASEYGRALGGAWGFLTEGGPGEAPMTFSSWARTTPAANLWDSNGGLGSWWDYHCGNPQGHFGSLHFYVPPLDARYGVANSAQTFTYMSQAANYEGIRAMFEGYSRNKKQGATGVIQWMMNNAWPSNIWNLFDYYLQAGGGYYGAKKACKPGLHPVYSYSDGTVWVVNSGYNTSSSYPQPGQGGSFWVAAEIVNLQGETVWQVNTTSPIPYPAEDTSFPVGLRIPFGDALPEIVSGTYLLKLTILQENSTTESISMADRKQRHIRTSADDDFVVLTDNWYWLSRQLDVLNWTASRWFRTPCSEWANFTGLLTLPKAVIDVSVTSAVPVAPTPFDGFVLHQCKLRGQVANPGTSLAFFVELSVHSASQQHQRSTARISIGEGVEKGAPDATATGPNFGPPLVAVFSDNYLTLRPGESKEFEVIVTLDHLYDEPASTGSSSMNGPTVADCTALSVRVNSYNNIVSGNV
jgi:exo-1,4-beta-D-glucosaminidase